MAIKTFDHLTCLAISPQAATNPPPSSADHHHRSSQQQQSPSIGQSLYQRHDNHDSLVASIDKTQTLPLLALTLMISHGLGLSNSTPHLQQLELKLVEQMDGYQFGCKCPCGFPILLL